MNITRIEFSKFSLKLTMDFAERYNRNLKSHELYVLPRILHFVKQKVSKTQKTLGEIFVLVISFSESREPNRSKFENKNFNSKLTKS